MSLDEVDAGEEKVAEPAVDDIDVEEDADDDGADHPFLEEEEEDDGDVKTSSTATSPPTRTRDGLGGSGRRRRDRQALFGQSQAGFLDINGQQIRVGWHASVPVRSNAPSAASRSLNSGRGHVVHWTLQG